MSAICGIFYVDDHQRDVHLETELMNKLSSYKIDKVNHLVTKSIFMGCALQYFTPESEKEILPFHDKVRSKIITADAIIDNREELLRIFNITTSKHEITDSTLILMAYEKWGQECLKHLIGDFAFVIWDEKKKELFCARDHVGKRTFYYYYSNKVFSFCTIMKPLLEANSKPIELNERWITDFLAIQGVPHESECSETIYRDIFQLPPANSMTVNRDGIKTHQYWNPLEEVKLLKLKNDKDYEDAFRKVFFEAVNCRLRSNNEIGIMLSGGLDSGSIACVAADELAKKNKRLKAFNSIPIANYRHKLSEYYIANESEYIEKIKEKYSNLDVTYCRNEGKDSLSDIDEFIHIFEQPYKIVENIFWYNGIMKEASNAGCKVLLDGQYGNSTISFGDFFTHITTLYSKKRFFTLMKEMKAYSKLHHIGYHKAGKMLFKIAFPYHLRKLIYHIRKRSTDDFSRTLVNKNLIDKWDVRRRFEEKNFNQIIERYYSLDEIHKLVVNPVAFSHIGAIETKLSLKHGVIKRDPTRDKRVIEFCLSLPSEQYVRNGQERHLIRRSMKGILPDKIRLNTSTRGIQGVDWIQRFIPKWSSFCEHAERSLENEIIKSYVDLDKLHNEFSKIKNSAEEANWYSIRMLVVVIIFEEFMKDFYARKKRQETYLHVSI